MLSPGHAANTAQGEDIMNRRALAVGLVGLLILGGVSAACSIAAAADTYLGDAIKTPSYSRALTNLLKGSGKLPNWTRQVLSTRGDYVGSTVDYVSVEGTRYELYNACKAYDCGDNALEVMFAPNGVRAWGALKVNGGSISYLGAPSPAQQSVLKGALQP
jgi:hypothetical protein